MNTKRLIASIVEIILGFALWICSAIGMIDSYWGDEQSGARRRYYRLTEKGCQRLLDDQRTWLETRRTLDLLLLQREAEDNA